MTYKRILVPVDGSATARLGLKEAFRLVREERAQLRLVHVVDAHALAMSPDFGGMADLLPVMKKDGERVLQRAQALAAKRGIKCSTALLETLTAPAADLIVREARKWRADLIVIGTHGRRGVRRLLMGSDAEQIVRTSAVPVLLVRARGKA